MTTNNLSPKTVSQIGQALAREYVEYLEADHDFYSLHIRKLEAFFVERGMKFTEDDECDLIQSILERVYLAVDTAS